ncbi:Mur ligase middle domain [Gaiella occulta]|uniref:Mur ligase middle domain n=1 Tax=Gaiella occulta TaxID=1002870 RepID=A0A7M2YV15_9ACTN|nr:Mur ligase family protein [Gaiella occulta]RDI73916.1 Mur ligase middle domain [Gaiella occulta]
MRLSELIETVPAADRDVRIAHAVGDARAAGPGALFVARKGTTVDGHAFVADAARDGCSAVVGADELPRQVAALLRERGVPYVPVELQRLLAQTVAAGCRYCFMKATSHAIDQRRTAAVDFDGGVFTTLDHDHLDYHRTLESYAAVERRFHADLPASAFALGNADSARGRSMVAATGASVAFYGTGADALLPWSLRRCDEHGMAMRIGPHRVRTRLLGEHTAGSLAAAVTAATLLGENIERVIEAVPLLRGAPGRMQRVASGPVLGLVDYAHTPAALGAALATARRLRPGGKLIVVGGCGGDKDRQKRPAMGAQIATADLPIFTSDNPRSEDPSRSSQRCSPASPRPGAAWCTSSSTGAARSSSPPPSPAPPTSSSSPARATKRRTRSPASSTRSTTGPSSRPRCIQGQDRHVVTHLDARERTGRARAV